MDKNKIKTITLFILLIITAIGLLFILKPFFSGIFLAVTFAIVAKPLHRLVSKKIKNQTTSATITFLIIVSVILIPTAILASQIIQEAGNVYGNYLIQNNNQNFTETSLGIIETLNSSLPIGINIDLITIKNEITNWLSTNINRLFSSALNLTINSFVFLFGLFYLIRDGHKLKRSIYELSPFTESQNKSIDNRLETTIRSVLVGSLFVALIQGIATAIGLIIFNIPEPFLLGSAATIAALVPGIGPSIIMLPAAVFLYFSGNQLAALGLTIWSLLIVGTIDNIARPFFIERGMKVHPFLILVSVIGGLIVFGPIGFVVGPVILSLFFSLIDIYQKFDEVEN